jgi:glutathione S-transferase
MNVGVRVAVAQRSPELLADIARIEQLWNQGLRRFGGPFLAGREFCAVDAFFAPVVYRFHTYGVAVNGAAAGYLETMLAHPAMVEWEAAALAEDFREAKYEAELSQIGTVTADLRAVAPAPTPSTP